MPMYTVKKGDWLSKIAAANDVGSWQEIYNHPANAGFKKKRPNPDLIYPGDVIFVPEKPPKPAPPKPDKPKPEKPKPKPKPAPPPVVVAPKPKPPKPAKPKPSAPKPKTDTSRVFDHQGGFRFRIEIAGVAAGSFRGVDGLSATTELIEYQGGKDLYARQIPGRPKIAPVVLKKGYINTAACWDWMKATMEGEFRFENCSIVLLTDDGQNDLARFNLYECWPSRWAGWQLDAGASNAMVEELELQVRYIERQA